MCSAVVRSEATPKEFEVCNHYLAMNEPGDWYDRCEIITSRMCEWIETYHKLYDDKSDVVIEEPVARGGHLDRAQAIQNRFLGMMLARLPKGARIFLAHPTSVKKCFTGNGFADKNKMVEEARTMYKHTHRTKAGKESIADAVGIAYTLWQYKLGNLKTGVVML